eukprot:1155592-Pelagomonas_calceolata.AAC.4
MGDLRILVLASGRWLALLLAGVVLAVGTQALVALAILVWMEAGAGAQAFVALVVRAVAEALAGARAGTGNEGAGTCGTGSPGSGRGRGSDKGIPGRALPGIMLPFHHSTAFFHMMFLCFQIWEQRPLAAELQEYAACDVRYLHALADALNKKLPKEIVTMVGLAAGMLEQELSCPCREV